MKFQFLLLPLVFGLAISCAPKDPRDHLASFLGDTPASDTGQRMRNIKFCEKEEHARYALGIKMDNEDRTNLIIGDAAVSSHGAMPRRQSVKQRYLANKMRKEQAVLDAVAQQHVVSGDNDDEENVVDEVQEEKVSGPNTLPKKKKKGRGGKK